MLYSVVAQFRSRVSDPGAERDLEYSESRNLNKDNYFGSVDSLKNLFYRIRVILKFTHAPGAPPRRFGDPGWDSDEPLDL